MNSDTRLRIVRIKLATTEAIIKGNSLEIVFGRHSPQFVLGPNGSGKSLMAAALHAFTERGAGDPNMIHELRESGLRALHIELAYGHWIGHGYLDFVDGKRDLNWNKVPSAWDSPGDADGANGHNGAPDARAINLVLDDVHFVERGRLGISPGNELPDEMRAALRKPLDQEYESWNARLAVLSGDDGSGGRVRELRDDLERAEQQLRQVTLLHDEYARAQERLRFLTRHAADLLATGEMLKAERNSLAELMRLGGRAERLERWMRELNEAAAVAAETREKIQRCDESLQHLERRFADAPPNLPDLVREFVAARGQEHETRTQLEILEQDRELALRTVRQFREEVEQLQPPPDDDYRAMMAALNAEMSALDGQLTEHHRGRIELVRQREGLELQLAHACPELAGLGDEQITAVVRFLDLKTEMAARSHVSRITDDEELRRVETRRSEIRARLRAQFADYEKLPLNSADLLKELADRRRILATLMADVEQLNRRKDVAANQAHSAARLLWAAVAALAGFALGTWAQGWDIGLFAAVLASGAALLLFKFLNRGSEQKLESILGAQSMSEARLREVRERINALEKQLHPLSAIGHLDEALNQYAEYAGLQREYEAFPLAPAPPAASEAFLQTEFDAQAEVIPPAIRMLSEEALKQKVADYLSLHERLRALDVKGAIFREDGEATIEAHQRELRLQHVKAELQELSQRHHDLLREFERRQADVEARVRQLELAADESPLLQRTRRELQILHTRRAELDQMIGPILNEVDPETLEVEWNARGSQRAERVRLELELQRMPAADELSARAELLREEFVELREMLLHFDPLYLHEGVPADYSAKYRSQFNESEREIEELQAEIERCQHELRELNLDPLAATIAREPAIDKLRERAEEAKNSCDTLAREAAATRELRDAVDEEITEFNRNFEAYFLRTASDTLRGLSDGALTECVFANGDLLIASPGAAPRPLTKLSEGAADLAGIAVRLAALEMLGTVEQGPVVWDEPFARLDDQRMRQVAAALEKICAQRQVVILTRDRRFAQAGEIQALGGDTRAPVRTESRT